MAELGQYGRELYKGLNTRSCSSLVATELVLTEHANTTCEKKSIIHRAACIHMDGLWENAYETGTEFEEDQGLRQGVGRKSYCSMYNLLYNAYTSSNSKKSFKN